jgi:hypothetical protein
VRSRITRTLLPIHDRWVPKYVNWCCVFVCTIIYPFVVTNKLCYLFQATRCRIPAYSAVSPGDSQRDAIPQKDRMTRFQFDYSLLSALLDHWRPETHTFHFTVTLQDSRC